FILFFCFRSSYSSNNNIRVAVKKDLEKFNLAVKGNYYIQEPFKEDILDTGRNIKADIFIDRESIVMSGRYYKFNAIDITPIKDGAVYIESRPYRGKIRIIKDAGKLTVVNIVPLEDYLKGVLEYEVSHWWPAEALKSQAVAARSYALYMKNVNKRKDYDLRSDALSQVYGGRLGERWRINRAVSATKGMVLTYNGKVLPAFYHSTCGGNTDNAKHIWNINIEPLKGVSCNFCRNSRHYRWHKSVDIADFNNIFSRSGYSWSSIETVYVKENFNNGYTKEIGVLADNQEHIFSGKDFRNILGASIIRSRRFDIDKSGNLINITGYGWGHGIGLCQWGSYGMARRGYKYNQILSHYYPKSELKKILTEP
ncbi:MAG: SpoIID/LytB domain-containing protein, partial [Candidatus Omnitrophica bacterium]|nr:SpoIID/LytB domain-containing protein [Candidatus Omnitrophota bacterium]